MKQRLWLFGLPFLVFVGLFFILTSALQTVQAGIETTSHTNAIPIPQDTLTCTTHTTGMTLTVSKNTLQYGETLEVTATLVNQGCSTVGLPLYRMMLNPPSVSVLEVLSPTTISHSLGLTYGDVDTATFNLRAIGSGTVNVRSTASFEVHLGYPGPAYWAGDATQPITITVAPTDTEIMILTETAAAFDCITKTLHHKDNVYTLGCAVAAGHSIEARIERFEDETSAQAAFSEGQGTLILEPLRCYPAYQWKYEQEAMPQHQGGQRWVAERWLITTHRVDDTGIPVAPAPEEISELIYRAAIKHHLFQACDRNYLPLVCNP